MILFLGAVGWGLFAIGAVTHIVHLDRLAELLSQHVGRHGGGLARLLAAAEVLLALFLPLTYLWARGPLLAAIAAAAGIFGAAFTAWVSRLYFGHSTLPCACSFSSAPTSIWSLLRSGATMLSVALAWAPEQDLAGALPTLLTGAAVATVIFTAPDALAWPELARSFRAAAETGGRRFNPGQRPGAGQVASPRR